MNRTFWCVLIMSGLMLFAVTAGLIIAEFVAPTTSAVIVPLETSHG